MLIQYGTLLAAKTSSSSAILTGVANQAIAKGDP
jgi:hypothetical protein